MSIYYIKLCNGYNISQVIIKKGFTNTFEPQPSSCKLAKYMPQYSLQEEDIADDLIKNNFMTQKSCLGVNTKKKYNTWRVGTY